MSENDSAAAIGHLVQDLQKAKNKLVAARAELARSVDLSSTLSKSLSLFINGVDDGECERLIGQMGSQEKLRDLLTTCREESQRVRYIQDQLAGLGLDQR
jgi:hypothetical protein